MDGMNSAQSNARPVSMAALEKKCSEASAATENAIMTLGRDYYEETKDSPDPKFSEKIEKIKTCMATEKLLSQYKLSLEGKMLCDSCGATITSDSVFCNKCGASVSLPDFSSIDIGDFREKAPDGQRFCPNCGAPFLSDAVFCERCGQKL